MRAVIADDSVLLREGITRILAEGEIDVIAGVGDAPSLLDAVETGNPDLAIIDVRMPPASATRACAPHSRSAAATRT